MTKANRRPLHPVVIAGLLVMLSFALNGYYLGGDFQADDFFFLNLLRTDPLPFSRCHGLWSVGDVPGLADLWWVEEMSGGGFWRPLPSLVFEGSIRLFGEDPFPLHLLSLVVHGLVAAILFLVVRRLTLRSMSGGVAALLFLSCEDHSMGVGWIATNTDLLCALFTGLALLGQVHWQSTRRAGPLVVCLTALPLAFLCKESAALLPVAMALLALTLPDGHEPECPAPWRLRLAGFAQNWPVWGPALLWMLIYLTAYKSLGYGIQESGTYVDPLATPVRFLRHAALQLPILGLAAASPVPPSLAMFTPGVTPVLAAAGLVVSGVLAAALWPQRHSGLLLWALGSFLILLLPQAATYASERGLYLPVIFSSVALAELATRVWRTSPRPPLLTRVGAWYVLGIILIGGAVLSAVLPFTYRASLERPGRDYGAIVPLIEDRQPDLVLVLNTPGPLHTFYGPEIVNYRASRRVELRTLSSLNAIVRVERLDEREFELRVNRSGWLTNLFAATLRAPAPLETGAVFRTGSFTATVAAVTRSGRDVLAVRFRLTRPLTDPGLLCIAWTGARFEPIDLASLPIGDPRLLADTSDIWASMY